MEEDTWDYSNGFDYGYNYYGTHRNHDQYDLGSLGSDTAYESQDDYGHENPWMGYEDYDGGYTAQEEPRSCYHCGDIRHIIRNCDRHCNELGHAQRDCWWVGPQIQRREQRCYSCGRPGHVQKDCWSNWRPSYQAVQEMPVLRGEPNKVDRSRRVESTTPQETVRNQPVKKVRFMPTPTNHYDALPVEEVSGHTQQLPQHTKIVGPSKAERKAI